MDAIWFLVGCAGFAWVVLWSIRDFTRASGLFWPFDARWMARSGGAAPKRWRRARDGVAREMSGDDTGDRGAAG